MAIHPVNDTVFAKNLEREIEKSGSNLTEVAKKSGVSVATLSRILSAQVNPSFANMVKIATALNMSLDKLAGRMGSIEPVAETLPSELAATSPAENHVLASYLIENTDLSPNECGKLLVSAANGTWQESWIDTLVDPLLTERAYMVMVQTVGHKKILIDLAFPDTLVESGSIASLVSILGSAMAGTGAKLVDVRIPAILLRTFPGPSFDPIFTLGPKHHIKGRPFLSATLRPMASLDQQLYYQSIYRAFLGGVDFTFDPSMMHSVPHLKWYDRLACATQAVHRMREESDLGTYPSHFINISAATVEEMIKRAEAALDNDLDTLMIDTASVGWSALQSLTAWAEDKHVTIAAMGSRSLQSGGMSEQVMAKLLRLAGCHVVSTPSPVSGSFSMSRRQVKGIIHTLTKKNYKADAELGLSYDQPTTGLYPSVPACGGGHTPWHFPRLLELLDEGCMIQCGGTVFAHPDGPEAGAEANLAALTALCEAKNAGRNIVLEGKEILKQTAKTSPALKKALAKWSEDTFLFGIVGKPKQVPDDAKIERLLTLIDRDKE